MHLCYYQKASKQLQIGVELEANNRIQESVASIGYQVDLPKSEVVFKGKRTPEGASFGFVSLAFRSHRLELVCGRRVRKKTKSIAVHLGDQRTDEPSEKQF